MLGTGRTSRALVLHADSTGAAYDRESQVGRPKWMRHLIGSAVWRGNPGSISIQFVRCDGEIANCLPIMSGRNYAMRLYRNS